MPTVTAFSAIRRRLLDWYRGHARSLPWRQTRDPYAIWVSEVMLQQTRVEVAREPWKRFLDAFPTVRDLAEAGEDQVLAAWSGLGYYRRARNLHRAARRIVSEHEGEFPREPRQARDLPGVGDYTAGAVLSIAYGRRVPAVDGNVRRVLARIFAIEGDPSRQPAAGAIAEKAQALAAGPQPGLWNQALMELGALVCQPGIPRCGACPLSGGPCAAEAEGRQQELPLVPARRPVERQDLAAVALEWKGRVLWVRKEDGGLVRGMWELPWVRLDGRRTPPRELLRGRLRRRHGLGFREARVRGEVRHAILHRRLQIQVWRGRCPEPPPAAPGEGRRWVRWEEAESLALSSLARKLLRTAEGEA